MFRKKDFPRRVKTVTSEDKNVESDDRICRGNYGIPIFVAKIRSECNVQILALRGVCRRGSSGLGEFDSIDGEAGR